MTTLFARKALLPGGWHDNVRLSIDGGCIDAVATDASHDGSEEILGCVIPGLCNAHSHAFQRALAGHTEERSPAGRDNFWSWRERMYALAGCVSADLLTAIARQAYCEMLRSGYTSVAEFHYLHRDPLDAAAVDTMFDAIVTAARDSGIRLTYVPVHYERAGFEDPEPTRQQASFAMSADEFLAHFERVASRGGNAINIGIGVHSLRAVSQASLARVAELAKTAGVPMHIHVAEQQREVKQCFSSYGRRPVRWLLENFDVGGNWDAPSYIPIPWFEDMQWAELAGRAKQATHLPVVYAGRVTSAMDITSPCSTVSCSSTSAVMESRMTHRSRWVPPNAGTWRPPSATCITAASSRLR